jgi:hypothetical protein
MVAKPVVEGQEYPLRRRTAFHPIDKGAAADETILLRKMVKLALKIAEAKIGEMR